MRGATWALAAAFVTTGAFADVPPSRSDDLLRDLRRSGADVPPENAASLREAPTIPPAGELEENARRLFDAVKADRPSDIASFFFPRDPFLRLKAIADPGRYWDVLMRAYERDIRALHQEIAHVERAEFVRFEFSRRRTWQTVRSEANALPYWCVRHSRIYYRVDGREASFEIRALIHWGRDWFVTHLK